ncbi:hypothetical protein DFH09DRAFT_158789 [Mycena vulgaris]|nr:hypothetical protein DFH09DRAFT_158789 [Mycena vulgaris]
MHQLLLRLSDRIVRDVYMRTILSHYAMLSQGLLANVSSPCPAMLILHVGLAPLTGDGRFKSRLCIQQISTVPVAILTAEIRGQYEKSSKDLASKVPEARPMGLMVHSNNDLPEAFGQIIVTSAGPESIAKTKQPGYMVAVYSNSTGQHQHIPLNLDALFSALENDLRLDSQNYYKMRG